MESGTQKMLEDIEAEIRYTCSMTGRDRFREHVMKAVSEVPRHAFVPEHEQRYAYSNGPLPIGHGQTISQPYIVALMTELLEIGPNDRVLEIGTGSGYQAAVLAGVVARVYSVEIISALAQQAGDRLRRLGFDNVEVRHGDGFQGWPEHGPYDGILVTAAAPAVPPPLIEQLKDGARLVIPVGPPSGHQELVVIRKLADGKLEENSVLAVAFVPLTRSPR